MRRQELNTISMAHKGAAITEQIATTGQLHLNSDAWNHKITEEDSRGCN